MPYAPTDILEARLAVTRRTLAEEGLEALVVFGPANLAYLTNFGGSAGLAVVTPDAVHFLTDSRYVTAVADQQAGPAACPGLTLVPVDGSYDATLAALLVRLGHRRVGYESAHLTVARHQWLLQRLATDAPALSLQALEGWVERQRTVKDAYELGMLATAGTMLSAVTAQVLTLPRVGMTERALAWAIDTTIRDAGFEKTAFETIVASGPNSALPHARPTGRTLREGDLVVLDFGGVYDSYCVDLTRTVAMGRPGARAQEMHAAVREAHDRAVAAVAPGVSRFAVDAAARDHLVAVGMGDAFGHGTGHGLGLEVHELPRIGKRTPAADTRDESLAPGMVFTIEPGVYVPGVGGVRIEDDVRVTSTGVELLTAGTTALLEL